ncbi:DUF6098 family protein [Gryllotalpicola ginsengisoli]|uniref:DUF6098 family protein n=1 Tax=Gryllotalpicola ginsengisoli TaxID=444608 RepID=UPI001FDFE033|nr:DUF6098 family protein [Gryllotalpicola ginsengisoli]
MPLPGDGYSIAMPDSSPLPVLTSLEEVRELVERSSEPTFLRYSKGPEQDAHEQSVDQESGLELPGLSTNPLDPEPWWSRPVLDWLARQICQYAHLRRDGDRYAWVLTGEVVGRGPDCEPLIARPRPLARLAEQVIDEADEVYSERFERS